MISIYENKFHVQFNERHLKGKIRSVKDNKSAGSHGLAAGEFYDIFQVYI